MRPPPSGTRSRSLKVSCIQPEAPTVGQSSANDEHSHSRKLDVALDIRLIFIVVVALELVDHLCRFGDIPVLSWCFDVPVLDGLLDAAELVHDILQGTPFETGGHSELDGFPLPLPLPARLVVLRFTLGGSLRQSDVSLGHLVPDEDGSVVHRGQCRELAGCVPLGFFVFDLGHRAVGEVAHIADNVQVRLLGDRVALCNQGDLVLSILEYLCVWR